jgi:hypothetical protein
MAAHTTTVLLDLWEMKQWRCLGQCLRLLHLRRLLQLLAHTLRLLLLRAVEMGLQLQAIPLFEL